MTSNTDQTQVLDVGERTELEKLRAEVARLREEAVGPPIGPRRRRSARGWWRTLLAVLLILVTCVLAPLSVVSVWARSEVTDTDRYVSTVAPLAKDPDLQNAVTSNLTNVVFQYVDVQGITSQAFTALGERGVLPPAVTTQLQALAVPIANGVKSFAHDQIRTVVQSDAFAQAWEQANRTAHQQLVAALTGQTSSVKIQDNAVKVDLGPFIDVVKQRLVASGFELASKIPQVNTTFTVFESAEVGKVQRGFDLLNTIGLWLPLILVAIGGLGIYLARNHRLAFIGAGLGIALAMLVAAVILQFARSKYLAGVPASVLPPDAAAVLFDTVVRVLREALRAAALTAVIVAIGAFLTGPSVTAVTVRSWCVRGFAALKGAFPGLGPRMHGVTRWTTQQARLLRTLIVGAAVAVVVLDRYRTISLVLWLTAGVLVALAVVEFLTVEPRTRRPRENRPIAVPAQA